MQYIKHIWWVLKLLCILVSLIVFLACKPLAQQLVDRVLYAYGFEQGQAIVEQVSWGQFVLRNVHLGDKEQFFIKKISVHYTLGNVWKKQLDYIQIEGVSLQSVLLDGGTVSFGFVDTLFDKNSEEEASVPDDLIEMLPFRSLVISDANLVIDTDVSAIELPFSLVVRVGDAVLDGYVKVDRAATRLVDMHIPAVGALSLVSRFSGIVPFIWQNKALTLQKARLYSIDEGHVQFNTNMVPADQNMKLLYDALADYRYTEFSLGLESDKTGHMTTGLMLEGKSVSLYDERDMTLNVNVTLNLYDMIKSIMGVYHMSDKVKEGLF